MNSRRSIKKTIAGFEESFFDGSYYNRQTRDADHLNMILEKLDIKSGQKILDLGTGSGYLAFALSGRHKDCGITGLDIVKKTMKKNTIKAGELGLTNLEFIGYDGAAFPFEDNLFDIVVTRYALHHFPDINLCFREISRVLKPGGQLFISDPTPNKEDTTGFVDRYMQMKDDGHIKFYTEKEFTSLGESVGLSRRSMISTEIRFPRKNDRSYSELLGKTDKRVTDSYKIEVSGDEIFISERVLNISFVKL
jgi:ubiquinone/menaquinone biosynthesis C-methylase UbiE